MTDKQQAVMRALRNILFDISLSHSRLGYPADRYTRGSKKKTTPIQLIFSRKRSELAVTLLKAVKLIDRQDWR
jgi:hypothetical protein